MEATILESTEADAVELIFYNKDTHETFTGDEMARGGWMLLDPKEERNADYEHPAYYNRNTHKVLESKDGSEYVDENGNTWVLAEPRGSGDGGREEAEADAVELIFYNKDTHETFTGDEMARGGWMLLDPKEERNADYEHPAYYNRNTHKVLESKDGSEYVDENGNTWVLAEPRGSGDGGREEAEADAVELIFYNKDTHETFTGDEMARGGWMLLDPKEERNADYEHPAYYNRNTHKVLESKDGSEYVDENGNTWVLAEPRGSGDGGREEAEADAVELIFYNKDTHETFTGDEMARGGWMLLDPKEERNADYEHPAYYNRNTHKVLESKDGSEYVDENGNTWVLAEPRGSGDGGREEAEADAVELIFYNKDTHETFTGDEMARGGWMLLDPKEERNADYEHPAYYNRNTHKVLESKDGSEYVDENGNTWVLAEPRGSGDGGREEAEADAVELIFYNKDTHETFTGDEMARGGWMLLDPKEERNADYEHPAYYNRNTHKVLESKDGSEYVDENGNTWVLAEPRGSGDGGREEAEADAVELIFYNKDTHETFTGDEMARGGWMLLDPKEERNADYEHPAYYNRNTHKVLESKDGSEYVDENGNTWVLAEPRGSGDGGREEVLNGTLPKAEVEDLGEVTYYNTSTHETKTLEQMLADGWVELKEENYGDKYKYPAIYSGAPLHQALDMSEGDKVGDWIVTFTDGHDSGGKFQQNVTEPYQTVSASSEEISFSLGNDINLDLVYTTSDTQNALTGLGLKVHYDSSLFTPSGENNGVSALVDTFGDPTIVDDTDDFDNDAATDKYLAITWTDFMGNFPGGDLPATLASLSFSSSKEGLDELTGESKESKINFTSSAPAQNYDFLSQSVTLKPQSFNLDVDGDGSVTALGDGLMVIRKLFGAAFAGDKVTDKAISNSATRTTDEIHKFIQAGVDEKVLDVDGDGEVTALGDGLMVIRKLFGAAFDGVKLTDKAISSDATRTTDEIHDYIAAMSDVGTSV